jgi:hypothetical protein
MIYYYAYGSNLHPLRLLERVPSAELVGVAAHPKHKLYFHKRSNDGSSKCNMFNSGIESDVTYGAIYKLNSAHKSVLDRFEWMGSGYMDKQIMLTHDGKKYCCFTYCAQQSYIVDNLNPYHWYKKLVILGARYLEFPESYISSIETAQSIDDPDRIRKKERKELIDRIINYR